MQSETSARSAVKALSWRLFATLVTTACVFLVTGKCDLAIGVGALDFVAKLVLYYAHERIWARIRFGKAAEKELASQLARASHPPPATTSLAPRSIGER